MNNTNPVEDIIDIISIKVEEFANATSWITNPLEKIKGIFSAWEQVVKSITIIIAIISLICLLIYFYPWWNPIFGKCLKICIRKSGKYRVNNIEPDPVPSAPQVEEPESFVLSYIPQSYMTILTKHENPLPLICLTIGEKTWLTLIDTGSNVTYCTESVTNYLRDRFNEFDCDNKEIITTNGLGLEIQGYILADIETKDMVIPIRIYSSNFKSPLIEIVLGTDFIYEINKNGLKFMINLSKKHVTIGPYIYFMFEFENSKMIFTNYSEFENNPGKLPKIKIKLNHLEFTALLDSGSSITYCRKSVAQKLTNNPLTPIYITGKAANGSTFNFIGKLSPIFSISDLKLTMKMLVSEDMHCPTDLILGTDFMQAINKLGKDIKFDMLNGMITFGDIIIPINSIQIMDDFFVNSTILQIRLSDTVELDAKTDNTLICNMIENNAVPFNNNAVFIIVGGDINLPFGIILMRCLDSK